MRPPRSDYESISAYYDDVRTFDPRYTEGWLRHIMGHGDLEARERILDVGCGTGRYSALIHRRAGRPVVGVDPSIGMLRGARERAMAPETDLRFVRGRAEALPFLEGSFDAAVLILVVHHVEDLGAMARELFRVLAPGGRVLFQTRSHDEIARSYIALFPGVLELDLARFPPIDHLEDVLGEAGFVGVGHALEENPDVDLTPEQILEKVDGRFISTLELMPEEDFIRGRGVFARRLRERYGEGPVPTASFTFVRGDVPH